MSAVVASISVHPETRYRLPPTVKPWIAVVYLIGGGVYCIPTGSERAAWLGVWALEAAGVEIPDAVLDQAVPA